jgi:hypothetical protein
MGWMADIQFLAGARFFFSNSIQDPFGLLSGGYWGYFHECKAAEP